MPMARIYYANPNVIKYTIPKTSFKTYWEGLGLV